MSKELVEKILREEKTREDIYPKKSIIDELNEYGKDKIREDNAKIGEHVLGRILDKTELAEKFMDIIPLYYDEACNWWQWDLHDLYWRLTDETDILVMVNRAAQVNVIASKEKTEILNALRLKARENKPQLIGDEWIQFKKEIINLKTGDRLKATPKYFITNPIPHKLGAYPNVDKFDMLFAQWVKPQDVPLLYEIIAYCLYPAYPIERIFTLLGNGANGKSTYLKILYTFLGMPNISTTNLETLSKSRFESTRLYRKLACIMAETNLANLDNSQLIKRLVSGKDPVPIEFKGKGLIDFINYAKVIIASNNLPPTDDKTDGFYRRWRIIEFPNQFEKEIDVLADITEEDYEALAIKSLLVLDDILKRRSFSGDGNIQERRKAYEEKSNPFDQFWNQNIDDSDPNSDIPCWEFEKECNEHMKSHHVRSLSDRTIMKLMKDRGINQVRLSKEWYEGEFTTKKLVRCWGGIKWKK